MEYTIRTITVTGKIGSSSNVASSFGEQTPATGQANSESVKTNVSTKQTDTRSIGSNDTPAAASNLSTGPDVERFTKELHIYLGMRWFWTCTALITALGAIIVFIWNFSKEIGQAQMQL